MRANSAIVYSTLHTCQSFIFIQEICGWRVHTHNNKKSTTQNTQVETNSTYYQCDSYRTTNLVKSFAY